MAAQAKATLGAVVAATVGGIAFVHWRQKAERAVRGARRGQGHLVSCLVASRRVA